MENIVTFNLTYEAGKKELVIVMLANYLDEVNVKGIVETCEDDDCENGRWSLEQLKEIIKHHDGNLLEMSLKYI